ncbi:MAG: HoxN/HupN/NixA family nickel/cobalt transporter [Caulobacteraceae bacterium]
MRAPSGLRRRIFGLYGVLAVANVGAWLWALAVLHSQPALLATAALAYVFGLRHAVDADHIAAIDNVTRKLMQEGQRPVTVGFWFAAGHSAVVVIAAALIATTASALSGVQAFRSLGGVISTCVSALFLFVIAFMNLAILRSVYRTFRQVRAGGAYVEEDLDLLLNGRGLLARLFRPLFRMVGRSWHMAPLGFLFGLGFDTATEVALLGLSASQATHGVSLSTVLVFPALFAAGMSLVDSTDGVLMLGVYEWAFVKPIRKLYYNMVITLVSALLALLIGGVETLALIARELDLKGGLWSLFTMLGDHFNALGFGVIGVLAASWVASALIYRLRRYDDVEAAALIKSPTGG